MPPKHKALMSYTPFDDRDEDLTRLRENLSKEVMSLTGKEFPIFQQADIQWGQHLQERIETAINEVTFFIPVITPSFFRSDDCRKEFQLFLQREKKLQRNDLILPIYYITVPELEDLSTHATQDMAIIAARKSVDWRNLRAENFNAPQVRERLVTMAKQIITAMQQVINPRNFVNRDEEQREACGKYAVPYMLFEAPAGYGKTELLWAIEQQHRRDGWLCVYTEIPKNTTSALELARYIATQSGTEIPTMVSIETIGHLIASDMKKQLISRQSRSGVVLLLDSVERIPAYAVDDFLNKFLVAIQNGLEKAQLRVRLAGRYIGTVWSQAACEFTLKVRCLSPFEFRYVRDTVQLRLSHEENVDLRAAYLLYSTGGHPACMAEIMKRLDPLEPIEQHFMQHHDSYYQQLVGPIAHEIRQSIPVDLQPIFDVLSVFRIYNLRLLKKMIGNKLITYAGDGDKLEKALTATYLVARKNGFIHDGIVRRLLAMRLHWEEPDRFIRLCAEARDIYAEDVQQTHSRPEYIAIETLYQELRLRYYQTERDMAARTALREKFFAADGILNTYLTILAAKPEAPDIQADLMRLLEDEPGDSEFRFVVNFVLRGHGYTDAPYKRMLEHIVDFFAHRQGASDDATGSLH